MAWIESHTALRRHRKTVALAGELRLKPEWVMGHLHALWHTALDQQEDGDFGAWTDPMIADAAGFKGDCHLFVSLLRKHGWLDGDLLHDWLDYAGRYLRNKYAKNNRQKLVVIWAKHGLAYGTGEHLVSQPNANTMPTECQHQPDIPNQTDHQPNVGGREKPSTDPGYHPDKVPKAQAVVDRFQSLTQRASSAGNAGIRAVIGCFIDGFTSEQLGEATEAYVVDCKKKNRKFMSCMRFYGDGHFKDFLGKQPGEQRIDPAEHNRKQGERYGGKPLPPKPGS